MSEDASSPSNSDGLTAKVFEVIFRLGIIAFLLVWAFKIILPFAQLMAGGAILAVALYPVFLKLVDRFGGKRKMVGTAFILISVAILVVPTVFLVMQSVESVTEVAEDWKEGEIQVPPPDEKVKEWPVIGEKTYGIWSDFSTNLEATAKKFAPQLKEAGTKVVGGIAKSGVTLLGFVFTLIMTGVFMIIGDTSAGFLRALAKRIVGEDGDAFVTLATNTIRSVALGVVGTAVIQATLAAIGLVLMGIPFAAVWAFLVLMLAIMQLPPILVLGPIAFYAFSTHSPVAAGIFLVWCLLVSFSDGILKPILLGRGVDIPMLVILIGALGGMMLSGIMGLFTGAVILALVYKLFRAWMYDEGLLGDEDGDAPEAEEAAFEA